MSRFVVVTDSTADIPPNLAAERDIEVVPLVVTIGGETLTDGVLSQAEFFKRMNAASELPQTSQPSVGAFVDAYERALARADEVVSVHISSKLSGTVASAMQAAEQFAGRVHVFDSLNLSWGLAFQVLDAASSAAANLEPKAALARLERVRERVRILVTLDSLDNLAKGGRIGRVSAFLGGMLNLKVSLTVDSDGSFSPVARSRGDKAAAKHTLDWVTEHMGTARSGKFAVMYAMAEDRAHQVREVLEQHFEAVEMYVVPTGSVIASHTGTGIGVASCRRSSETWLRHRPNGRGPSGRTSSSIRRGTTLSRLGVSRRRFDGTAVEGGEPRSFVDWPGR